MSRLLPLRPRSLPWSQRLVAALVVTGPEGGWAFAPLADPTSRMRLKLVGTAALAPVVVAVVVSGIARLAPAGGERATGSAAPIVAAPWTPTSTVTPSSPPSLHGGRTDNLRPGEALSSALARHGVHANDASALLRALHGVLPGRAWADGASFAVRTDEGRLSRFVLHADNDEGAPRTITAERIVEDVDAGAGDDEARATPARARFAVQAVDAPVDTVVEGLAGQVDGKLDEAMLAAGGDAALVDRFVGVFAWDVDIHRVARRGDEFRVLVEKRYADDRGQRRFLGYGRVVAAEYVHAGEVWRGFAWRSADGHVDGVFDELGASRKRALLRSPLDPAVATAAGDVVVRGARAGVDYVAPLGTPVWTAGDGVVVSAGFRREDGNVVVVDHGGGVVSEYAHLARFAEGMRAGVRVTQKQLVGFVGSTGRSSTPHLRWGLRIRGAVVDPRTADTPATASVPGDYRASFAAFVGPLLAQLRALHRA
jgi:murein DD-endopeptidase MepM/ murein hydrolase activator NlpD